jgi:hypothetical protein
MSTDFSNRRLFCNTNIGTLVVSLGLKNRSSATFLLMSAAALRIFSLEAESWVSDERRNVTSILYSAVRKHQDQDLLLRQCACIGSNMIHKCFSQSFSDLVTSFDLSPGCSFAVYCCQRLFGLQLRSRRICDPGHERHSSEIQRLLLWTALCHFLGNICKNNDHCGMRVGGILKSAGFVPWLTCTVPGFTAIIPLEVEPDPDSSASLPSSSSRASGGRRQSQSGLVYTHTANTYEEFTARMTQDGSEELSLIKQQRTPVICVSRDSRNSKVAPRPSSGIRTDTFDAWNQHGLRAPQIKAGASHSDASSGSTSILTHTEPAATAVVEAAVCQLMRLISNFCELSPSILLTAPYDAERGQQQSIEAVPPSINGVCLLCDDILLPKLLDFFQAAIQYRSAALYAAAALLKMQGQSNLDADIAARIQILLLAISRRYFPKIMKSELHEFVCIAPRCLPSIPSAAELHHLVGVAYANIDPTIEQLLRGRDSDG